MPTPPADFDAFLENPANDRELHSVFSSALTLTSLVDAGAIRQHLGAWGASLAPRLVERLKPLIARWTPDETSLVAALAGDPGLFEAEVRVLAERAENVRARAEEADVTAQRAILEVAKAAQAQIRLRTQTASSDRTALSRLLDLLNGVLGSRPVAELPDLGTLPEALRHTVLDVAKEVLRGEILLAVAAQLDEIVTRARGRLEAGQKGREALDAARDRIRRIVGERIAALPRREGILPQDIVLDDDAAISRLVRKAPPFDATLQVENLDAATAEKAIRGWVADQVKDVAQRHLTDLLPALIGATLRDRLDQLVRDAAPLARLRREELPDRTRYDGITIGIVETEDPALRAALIEAMERVGDVAVMETNATALPPTVLARIVRFAGILPMETATESICDLMTAAGAPDVFEGTARDWVEDLPDLIATERLREEIARRKRRKEPTQVLEGWIRSPAPAEAAPDSASEPFSESEPDAMAAK